MATTFKTFLNNDITTTKTLLHEAIPITGAIVSGTYNGGDEGGGAELNVKNYSHGMFQSVYDYPYLSSSANHIFDISVGYAATSSLSGSRVAHDGDDGRAARLTTRKQQDKKIAMYNQMAQILMGHNTDGSIRLFDNDGNVSDPKDNSDSFGKMKEVIFINFSRLLVKDEIKKGSFQLDLGVHPVLSGKGLRSEVQNILTIKDTNAQNDYRINSPAGEYGILSASIGQATTDQDIMGHTTGSSQPVNAHAGLIFYQAGIAVLTASVFAGTTKLAAENGGLDEGGSAILENCALFSINGIHSDGLKQKGTDGATDFSASISQMLTGSKIEHIANGIRRRIHNISFNNTTELNSTVYFCRANHNEFNYSANPTYLQSSKIRVKDVPTDMPVSYVTSIGLYSPDNELMATAKLSEPLRKDPTNELTLRVRLDY